jgi:hypothetical protein
MARALGPGVRIDGGGLAIAGPFARIYAQAQPLGGANPGTYDSNGQYLHFRYHGNLNLGARSGGNQTPGGVVAPDFVPNKIVVEFDVASCFTLPFEGFLELVGGDGDWIFGMEVTAYIDPQFYEPELRTLRTRRNRGAPFTIPNFHTYFTSLDPAATFILPGGEIMSPGANLPGVNVTAGTTITVGPTPTWVTTGWRG